MRASQREGGGGNLIARRLREAASKYFAYLMTVFLVMGRVVLELMAN